jgi:hypothetical protein
MATEPISEYQKAIHNVDAAKAVAERLVAVISDAANKLRNWQQVMVSCTSAGFPPEVAVTKSHSINAGEWPTGQQLAEALAAYHHALHEASNAYRRIPEGQRGVVQPPPSR